MTQTTASITPADLGKRIAIMGVAGAGKSTLAIRLNKHLHLLLYHTD